MGRGLVGCGAGARNAVGRGVGGGVGCVWRPKGANRNHENGLCGLDIVILLL